MLRVILSASTFADSEGVPVGMVSVIRDVTQGDNSSDATARENSPMGRLFESLEGNLASSQDAVSSEPQVIKEAVRLLIHFVQAQKSDLQDRIAHNLEITVQPLIKHLKCLNLTEAQRQLVETLDFNVKHIASYFGATVLDKETRLTPRELQICHMIRSGQNSREIAQRLGLTYQTVIVHRKNIRNKLGLKKSKGNLASYVREAM